MTAAATPSRPVFNVPPTAPVLEFGCLYTHDIRRKSKRWQDGYLKYHTFNKRIMVYDVPRNFIGDHHWQEAEGPMEGDEVTLDMGVLVQVCERRGTSQTDVSVLFQRNRKSSPAKDMISPGRLPLANAHPQLRPKSLNSLLGPSHGSMGRSKLPNTSPFERRDASRQRNMEAEHPVKRARLSEVKTTTPSRQDSPLRSRDYADSSRPPLAIQSYVHATGQERKEEGCQSKQGPDDTMELVSSAGDRVFTHGHAQDDWISSSVERISPVKTLSARSTIDQPANIDSDSTRRDKRGAAFSEEQKEISRVKRDLPVTPVVTVASKARSTTGNPVSPLRARGAEEPARKNDRKRIKLASRAPRRLVVLQDLYERGPAVVAEQNPKHNDVGPKGARQAPDPQEDDLPAFRRAQRERVEARLASGKRASRINGYATRLLEADTENTASIVPQSRARERPTVRKVVPDQPVGRHALACSTPDNDKLDYSTNDPDSPPGQDLRPPPSMATEVGRMDKVLLRMGPSTSTKPRSLNATALSGSVKDERVYRRVRSANDAPGPGRVDLDAQGTTGRSQPQRAQSLNAVAGRNGDQPVDPEEDLGPWSREALDLFDWRPPNRDQKLKLKYG